MTERSFEVEEDSLRAVNSVVGECKLISELRKKSKIEPYFPGCGHYDSLAIFNVCQMYFRLTKYGGNGDHVSVFVQYRADKL